MADGSKLTMSRFIRDESEQCAVKVLNLSGSGNVVSVQKSAESVDTKSSRDTDEGPRQRLVPVGIDDGDNKVSMKLEMPGPHRFVMLNATHGNCSTFDRNTIHVLVVGARYEPLYYVTYTCRGITEFEVTTQNGANCIEGAMNSHVAKHTGVNCVSTQQSTDHVVSIGYKQHCTDVPIDWVVECTYLG